MEIVLSQEAKMYLKAQEITESSVIAGAVQVYGKAAHNIKLSLAQVQTICEQYPIEKYGQVTVTPETYQRFSQLLDNACLGDAGESRAYKALFEEGFPPERAVRLGFDLEKAALRRHGEISLDYEVDGGEGSMSLAEIIGGNDPDPTVAADFRAALLEAAREYGCGYQDEIVPALLAIADDDTGELAAASLRNLFAMFGLNRTAQRNVAFQRVALEAIGGAAALQGRYDADPKREKYQRRSPIESERAYQQAVNLKKRIETILAWDPKQTAAARA